MKAENIVVINRWDDDFAAYDRLLDHQQHRIFYIVNKAGSEGIRHIKQHTKTFVVDDLEDISQLMGPMQAISDEHGQIDRLLALSEFDLIQAAELRSRFRIPGVDREQVKLFRDKVSMKERLLAKGLSVPRFLDLRDSEEAIRFAAEVGYPLILKPRTGAASQGVYKVDTEADLRRLLQAIDITDYECEEYVDGPIYHVDGVIHQQQLLFVRPSRYIHTCLDFNHGQPLGSVMLPPGEQNDTITLFTKQVLQALGLERGIFHLEIIMRHDSEPVFLEIGARIGGGEIPFLFKDLYGLDLVKEWVDLELDQFKGLHIKNSSWYGGFLMVPEPAETPCEVVERTDLIQTIGTLYKQILPEPGQILDGNGGYLKIGGRFRYKSLDPMQIERDIAMTIEKYKLITRLCD
ncbi:ATP-grasp domain-containing protein [Laceyella sediminis]|uniref:ATP-grasp domain-containing protein n=1 Tax=Laceyella sediminis TaxID=573074 RepID=A0ABX5EPR3_9BACL|nr:ATP-grasp domain-containing protein [Laceyella sediminis]PRZ14891.1 ATP-grasp domain-containing protein [Laceyella sediminis]